MAACKVNNLIGYHIAGSLEGWISRSTCNCLIKWTALFRMRLSERTIRCELPFGADVDASCCSHNENKIFENLKWCSRSVHNLITFIKSLLSSCLI